MTKNNRGGMWRPFSFLYSAGYLLFSIWVFAGSYFSYAGSYTKRQMEPSYVLCLPQPFFFFPPPYFMFAGCLIYVKLSWDFRVNCWNLIKLKISERVKDGMESQAPSHVCLVEVPRACQPPQGGQPEVVLVVFYRWEKGDIKRLSELV